MFTSLQRGGDKQSVERKPFQRLHAKLLKQFVRGIPFDVHLAEARC
jgi:hypothetical protein